MKKLLHRNLDNLKLVLICTLAIGAFSALYTTTNQTAFAAATATRALTVQATEQSSSVSPSQIVVQMGADRILRIDGAAVDSDLYVEGVQVIVRTDQIPGEAEGGVITTRVFNDDVEILISAPYIAPREVPPPVASHSLLQLTAEETVPITLYLLESPWQTIENVPEYALSMDEAAQIIAAYIWDVFAFNIDGMYLQLDFSAWEGQTRVLWCATVAHEASFFCFESREGDRQVPTPLFNINIDAITGMRVDIHKMETAAVSAIFPNQGDRDRYIGFREALLELNWFDKSTSEQLRLLNVTDEELEIFLRFAHDLAQRHFVHSTVVSVSLYDSHAVSVEPAWLYDPSAEMTSLSLFSLHFSAVDNTGREALISIPGDRAQWRSYSVSTSHNDMIPYYWEIRGGIG